MGKKPHKGASKRKMGRRKADGPRTLEIWVNESPIHHRALLLTAMQLPTTDSMILNRNITRTSQCTLRTAGAVLRTAKRRHWVERILGHGKEAARYAAKLYVQQYHEAFASHDLPIIRDLLDVEAIGIIAAPPTEVQKEAIRTLKGLIKPPEETEETKAERERTRKAMEVAMRERRNVNAALRGATLELIRLFHERLKDTTKGGGRAKIRMGVADLDIIRKMHAELEIERARLEQPGAITGGSTPITDSVRVQLAKATGDEGMVGYAHLEDSREMNLVLEQLFGDKGAANEGTIPVAVVQE